MSYAEAVNVRDFLLPMRSVAEIELRRAAVVVEHQDKRRRETDMPAECR